MKATIIICDSENLNEEILNAAAQKAAEFLNSSTVTDHQEKIQALKEELQNVDDSIYEALENNRLLQESRNILSEEVQLLELRKALLEQEAKVKNMKPKQPSRVAKVFKALSSHIAGSKRMPLMGLFTKPKQTA